MAEGDTILGAARRIEAALGGRRLEVRAPNPRGRAAGVERIDGAVPERAEARGKHLLLHCGPLVLHSHLAMSGSWHLYSRGESWRKPPGAAWAVLRGDESEAVEFGGPTLRVLRAESLGRDPTLARLGPDVLAPDLDLDRLARGIVGRAPERALGDALLDQTLVAGIGNIFKSESCFAARVSPWGPLARLEGADEVAAVLGAARELMLAAVAGGRRPHSVYRRAGRPCRACGTPIASRGQGDANRVTYWCPNCQGG